ncbi:hypothetical protein DLJ53_33795 [Acuticoccus sediminis]|uniref:Uncharacterized protein n=1 Tax=Acuticoccus sediminis TaxID=2184697 RepID=A0A8B2NCF3_9HYPH|nr:hypothetical protein [Acuticoccus sediminis]RAH95886.1 hypothetical protein DLJ53_33795 [Acuticoccus sediminis]
MSGDRRTDPADVMTEEDFGLPTDIFVSRRANSKRGGLHYHRFATAAEAIEFALENYSSARPDDLVMSVDDKRFNLAAVKVMHRRARTLAILADAGSS